MTRKKAAIGYAESDTDGHIDGLYLASGYPKDPSKGHPIVVICPDGTRQGFLVSVEEFEAIYGAVEQP